jgi:hypothetical protein
MLSRSRRYRLPEGQPRVRFLLHGGGMDVQEQLNVVMKDAEVSVSPRVEALLTHLQNHPID